MTTTTQLRKTLLANGYTPTPNVGKACYMKGWPTVEVDDDTIEHWGKRHTRFADTGIRVENDLAVIDIDINHEVIEHVARAIEEAFPQVLSGLVRYGKGYKEAWFVRTREPFTRLHTRRWLASGADLERDGAQVVEIFGGASPRQFGAFGAHTRDDNGSVVVAYEWADDASPATVRLSDLPELSRAELLAVVDLAEQVLEAHGFTPVLRSTKGESEAHRVFDIPDDARFECNDDVLRSLAELEAVAGMEGMRCSASWLEPGAGHSLTRCLIGQSSAGVMTVWDAATGITHMPAKYAPEASDKRQADAENVAVRLKRLAELEEERKTKRRSKLNSEDRGAVAAGKIAQSFAYCASSKTPVVPLWATSTDEGFSMTNFRGLMQPYSDVEIGPRGGEKKINPVDVWMSMNERINVEGLRMRPDMPRPTYEDELGRKWVNTYAPAIHKGAEKGTPQGGLDLITQLLPDPVERRWFMQWLAFKWLNPGIPGPAVVMVARGFGSGRGTLGELVRLMFGSSYVRTLAFDTFAGRTYQSQYNDWGANALVVMVSESSTSDGGSAYKAKHDTYERLKEMVEPRPVSRHFVVKGEQSFFAPSFSSYMIFTNNPDALPLPLEDRRFWVGTNGEPREEEFWERINAWMENPDNVAAFIEWLEAVDLTGYSPFACPPMTDGKRAMSALSESEVDKGFEIALANVNGEVVAVEQIIGMMRTAAETYGFDYPDRWQALVKRKVHTSLHRVGITKGKNWFPQIEGKRYAVFALEKRNVGKWTNADAGDLHTEILRSGSPAGNGSGAAQVLAGLFKRA